MSDPGLAACDIYKIYKNGPREVRAVNGMSLEVKKGESLAIVGPSGAGKSTLLHLLGGLDNPTSGKVLLDGIDIYRLSDGERAKIRNRKVGFVFQFYHLLPEFTALENVMLPALIKAHTIHPGPPFTKAGAGNTPRPAFHKSRGGQYTIRKRAEEVLKSVGLEDRINHKPSELSGGESQRVAIARGLVNEPQVLLCDEPTGNLDSKTSESIYELLLTIQLKTGMTLIIVTHDEHISSKIKEIIHIKDGKII